MYLNGVFKKIITFIGMTLVIKLYRFQGYNSVIHHLCIASFLMTIDGAGKVSSQHGREAFLTENAPQVPAPPY